MLQLAPSDHVKRPDYKDDSTTVGRKLILCCPVLPAPTCMTYHFLKSRTERSEEVGMKKSLSKFSSHPGRRRISRSWVCRKELSPSVKVLEFRCCTKRGGFRNRKKLRGKRARRRVCPGIMGVV